MSHSPAWSGLDQSESDVTLVHLPGTRHESLSSLEWPRSERVGSWSGLDQSESDVTLVHLPGTRHESLSSLEWPRSERVGCNSSPPTWYTA
ncbi:hypothetical protein RRG08_067389 [Elysia crispata]|uniref:Uncharacterized protein n=1 Tax=Elysia crispata TaxID=231223 RepID=A0AAE1CUI4_9GAST|nr:hypothetical protein RRG08_067389 [Elysia crispata]